MEIKRLKDGSGIMLIKDNGALFHLSFSEFWAICKEGKRLDIYHELEEYLNDFNEIRGVDTSLLKENKEWMNKIVNKIIEFRIENERSKQIYDAILKIGVPENEKILLNGYPLNDLLPEIEIEIMSNDLQKILDAEFNGISVEAFLNTYTFDDTDIIQEVIQSNSMNMDFPAHIKDYGEATYMIHIYANRFEKNEMLMESLWPTELDADLAKLLLHNYKGFWVEIEPIGKDVIYSDVIDETIEKAILQLKEAESYKWIKETNYKVGTIVKVINSDDKDLVNIVGELTHAFPGLMELGYENMYVAGLKIIEPKGVFMNDICNIMENDAIEIVHELSQTTNSLTKRINGAKDLSNAWNEDNSTINFKEKELIK